jgi:hypothetical protein
MNFLIISSAILTLVAWFLIIDLVRSRKPR